MLNNQEVPTRPILIKDLGMLFPTEKSSYTKRFGIFRCICGKEFKAQHRSISSNHTKSCGCHNLKMIHNSYPVHGNSNHRISAIWYSMINRCNSLLCKAYKNYGGRGIKVCDRWLDIKNFIEDMYPTYEEGLTIDRIDNNSDYELSNCRWTNRNTQSRNTRLIHSTNKTGFRGVSIHKKLNKFQASIGLKNKKKYLGVFATALEAAVAYDKYVIDNNLEHTINGVLL